MERMTYLKDSRFLVELRKQKLTMVSLGIFSAFILIAIFAGLLPITDPFALSSDQSQAPSMKHFMGTDNLGRDIFARVLWGTRASLLVGVFSAGLSCVIGIVFGALAGYYGGWIDDVLSRFIDVILSMPIFFLLILVVALFGNDLFFVIVCIGGVTWPSSARIMRAQALTLRQRAFVMAAIGSGQSNLSVLFLHVVPNGIGPVLVNAVLGVAAAILIESSLSFLGIGVQPPIPSWGNILAEGKATLGTAWWLMLFPGLAIFFTVLGYNLLGEGLREALSPKRLYRK